MKSSVKLNLDKLGICTSAVCALHCLLTPLIILLFPFASIAFLEWEGVELGLLVLSFFFAITSLALSYFRKHRNAKPLIFAAIGFTLFGMGRLISLEAIEIILSIIGGSFVIVAHYFNLKLIKSEAL